MRFKDLLEELDILELPMGEYAISGSGPLAIRGIRDSKDLDILVTEELWNALTVKYSHKEAVSLRIGNIEVFCEKLFGENSVGPKVEEQIRAAETIQGYPFVNLETIKFYKRLGNRDKDKHDLQLIEQFERVNSR
jgi:hypothetical protein